MTVMRVLAQQEDQDCAIVALAMVLIGAGRSFIAGADIRMFGKPRPVFKRVSYDVLNDSAKPIVAAIHGFALGGGLEHAMACNYRVAVASAKAQPHPIRQFMPFTKMKLANLIRRESLATIHDHLGQ